MATINLSWTPAGGANSTGQKVQRRSGGAAFADIASLSVSASTYSDTTAVDNVLYTYQIINLCVYGGPTDSADVSKGVPVCPPVEHGMSENNVVLYFPTLSGDATYTGTVELPGIGSFSSSGTKAAFTVEFSGEFGGSYNYSFSISVGDETVPCGGSVTIGAAPACPVPSGLSASVENSELR